MAAEHVIGAVAGAASLVGAVTGAISGALGTAAKIKEIAEKTKNIELQEVVIELRSKLLDAKQEGLTLREENERLNAEVSRLSALPEVQFRSGLYYKKVGNEGPFCPGCYDAKAKLVHLTDISIMEFGAKWQCPSCQQPYC
ncbi:MAG: hypothetical protein K2X38_01000 [Gemmataceae bacterium]|nr:hypothetical protein [Gemmataceae bacterium]